MSGLVFGFGISFHPQFMFIFPIFIPLLVDVIKNKKIGDLIYLVVGPILPFLPIFLFDLRHGFLNFKQIIKFINMESLGTNRVLLVWERASSFMVGGAPSILLGLIIYFIVSIGLFVMSKKTKDNIQGKMLFSLGLVWATSVPLFYLLIKDPSEYYFNYLLIPLILLIAVAMRNLKRFGILILIATIIYFMFPTRPLLNNVALSLREKDKAVLFLSDITKNSSLFNISFDVPFNEDTGFRYLLNYRKVVYSNSPKDPLIEFIIFQEKRQSTFKLDRIGIYIPSEWLKNNWPKGVK